MNSGRSAAWFRRIRVARAQRLRYAETSREAEVSPWRIIWINPKDISHVSRQKGVIYPKSDRVLSHILDGDWDLDVASFWANEISEAIRQRIRESKPWRETALVRRLYEELSLPNARPQWHKCRTPEEVDQRCAKIDGLIASIRDHGFLPPRGILFGRSGLTTEHPPDAVSIAVTRVGTFQHLNGRHRLAIAKSLNLDQIPVRIGVRHALWQQQRATFLQSNSGHPPEHLRHPDVYFLLERKGSGDA